MLKVLEPLVSVPMFSAFKPVAVIERNCQIVFIVPLAPVLSHSETHRQRFGKAKGKEITDSVVTTLL